MASERGGLETAVQKALEVCWEPLLSSSDCAVRLAYVGAEQGGWDRAFERFAEQTRMNPKALPLFVTLPGERIPHGLPAEFSLSVFELRDLKERARKVHELRRSKWWLLEHCFPLSFARYWLGSRFVLPSRDSGRPFEAHCARCEQRLITALLGWPHGRDDKDSLTVPVAHLIRRRGGDSAFVEILRNQWEGLVAASDLRESNVDSAAALRTLEALIELNGKPGILFLDDLAGRSQGLAAPAHDAWHAKLAGFRHAFEVCAPVLPVQSRHGENADELLPVIRSELAKLSRPFAAVVDMNWLYADGGGRNPLFGLELVRLVRQAKPNLPVFVWSPIHDRRTQQRAMQLGAASFFDKEAELAFGHEASAFAEEQVEADRKTGANSTGLTPGQLWFHILEWENTRYHLPPVDGGTGAFLVADSADTRAMREKFLGHYDLTDADLLSSRTPDVIRLLRALVPRAAEVEVLRFFGEGLSGSDPPFMLRGKTRSGSLMRPLQVKLGRDWRALARESKGYRDVFASALGPSVAHVEAGPFRVGEWCGMAQSLAAPEEAIRQMSVGSTRSLLERLRENLDAPEVCEKLVDDLFSGVLDPFYDGNLKQRLFPVFKAFERVSPPHLEASFHPAPDVVCNRDIDLSPEVLSKKDDRARAERAYRAWRGLEVWYRGGSTDPKVVRGLVVDTLEVDRSRPNRTRLRLLDPTLGIKVDLLAADLDVARRWETLAESPVKLRGLPVAFTLRRDAKLTDAVGSDAWLLAGWQRAVAEKLRDAGLDEEESRQVGQWFYPTHPVDWMEEFSVGPTHGDLNLGNVLFHEKNGSFFPWLIDFDKAERDRPVVFDLAKLEIEAYHNIAQQLWWEVLDNGWIRNEHRLRRSFDAFERTLESASTNSVSDLFDDLVPKSIRRKFQGLFAYLKRLRQRVTELRVGEREFLLGRAVYCFCCLKFKHLYDSKRHPNAPFPAKVLFWKLKAMISRLDRFDGIPSVIDPEDRMVIARSVEVIRAARAGREPLLPLGEVVLPVVDSAAVDSPDSGHEKWKTLLRLLKDKRVPGERRWFREFLWYARDYGVATKPTGLADFTVGMVLASEERALEPPEPRTKDFASTGRVGNAYPARQMLDCLAQGGGPFVKVSSRGESGGTIDVLEQAGVRVCTSNEAIDQQLRTVGWAVAEASDDLCGVDKAVMALRKPANCMKVDDLVIASISAKKLAVGIKDFDVQIVTGYDAKLSEGTGVHERWRAAWERCHELLRRPSPHVCVAEPVAGFDSDSLLSWFNSDGPTHSLVVFGSALLAAQLWRDDSVRQEKLRRRLPKAFGETMDRLARVLTSLETKCQTVPDALIISLTHVDAPDYLRKLACWKTVLDGTGCPEADGVTAVIFKFESDMRSLVLVPYFDALYARLAKSRNPLAGVVFSSRWLAVLCGTSEFPEDLHSWAWQVLRDGFRVDRAIAQSDSAPARAQREVEVTFEGSAGEYDKVRQLLRDNGGFVLDDRGMVERLHYYFDPASGEDVDGRRLRVVLAPGEWARYDFKRSEPDGTSSEVPLEAAGPMKLDVAVETLIGKASRETDRLALQAFRGSTELAVALLGRHHKTSAVSNKMELEVSWDEIIVMNTGDRFDEVEVELVAGSEAEFESLMSEIEAQGGLERVYESKLARARRLKAASRLPGLGDNR